jgi:hypothetical protein
LSFEVDLNSTLDTIVDIAFFTDIVINFNTSFYSNGKLLFLNYIGVLIVDRSRIVKKYLRAWFWIDLFSTIPYDRAIESLAANNTS